MVLGSRRRAVTAAASALAAVALAVAVAGRGCHDDDESPEGAVRAFAAAARAGDRDAVMSMLGPRTHARLAADAERATQLAGGDRRVSPRELVSLSEPGERRGPRAFVVRERSGATAVVDIITADGVPMPINVVEVDGRWRIELF